MIAIFRLARIPKLAKTEARPKPSALERHELEGGFEFRRVGTLSALLLRVTQTHVEKHNPDLRERALREGVTSLDDSELLAILLGTGSEGESVLWLAAELLASAGGLPGVRRLGPHAMAARRGIGPAKAARVAAALELGQRAALRSLPSDETVIASVDAVATWAKPRLAPLEHEEVWLLALDARNRLKTARRIGMGGLHGCAVTAKDVLAPALRDAASCIVLVHNHPSGDPEPSPEDFAMTRALESACATVGLPLLDHVIVSRNGCTSLFERGAIG